MGITPTSAESAAKRKKLFATRWADGKLKSAVDPSFDVLAIRHADNGR